MFLLTLIVFPFLSYFIFNMYKNNYLESNWSVKLIWVLWLFIIIMLVTSEIFNNKVSYLVFIIIWYILVFLYYYFSNFKLELKNISKLKYSNFSFTNAWLKILFMIFIFIFYINVLEDRDVTRSLDIFRYNSDWLLNTIYLLLVNILLYGFIYEIADSIKNTIFKSIINKTELKRKLKMELKREILKELQN
jgi:hypothetical protein